MKVPDQKHSISTMIDKWFEDNHNNDARFHFGASIAGHECERYLWLNFRLARKEKFKGRILRLFKRGQDEEEKVVFLLKKIGLDISNYGENQLSVDLGSHVCGSLDGIINSGVPGALKTRHILEIKTHNKKSFSQLIKLGVEKSHPKHYIQMQIYMFATGVDRALYVSLCKDNDEIYTERVKFDPEIAEKYIERSKRIATQDELPPPISHSKTWYQCKMCHFSDFCHGDEKIFEKNCRTCRDSTACEDGTWFCENHKGEIQNEWQLKGCKSYELHDHLVK